MASRYDNFHANAAMAAPPGGEPAFSGAAHCVSCGNAMKGA
ncbi:hypothetical protein [Ancylobacter sp. IITR112]